MKSKFMMFILSVFVCNIIGCGVIYVDKDATGQNNGLSWESAYNHPLAALNAAGPFDQIWVAEGTYTGMLSLKSNSKIYGGFNGTESALSQRDLENNPTIFDAEGGNYAISSNGYGFTLDGLTITGANRGLFNESGNTGIIINCIFRDNTTGIINMEFSSPTTRGCSFENNDTGIINRESSSPDIRDCSFINNSTGIRNFEGAAHPFVENCIFKNNTSAISSGPYAGVDVTGSTFIENDSAINFGAHQLGNEISDSVFYGNTDGAIFNYGDYGDVEVKVKNCTFYNNSGYALDAYEKTYTVENCIFWDNENEISSDSISSVTFSNVKGGFPGLGNIGEKPEDDPMFVDPENGDLHLQTDSPCIDVGNNLALPLSITDIDGDPRIIDGDGNSIPIVDMGADEYKP